MQLNRIYQNVTLGEDCHIAAFASVGLPPRGYEDGDLETVLGDRVEVKTHATVCSGNTFGSDVTIGHGLYMRNGSQIGDRVSLGSHSNLEWDITIKNDVTIGSYAGIAEYSIIDEGCWIGHQVSMPSVLHPLCPKAKECGKGSHLHRAVTVGPGVTIYPDLQIGTGSVIEAGSVVVNDVPPFAVMQGNPAKQIGDIFSLEHEAVKRIAQYVDLSAESIQQIEADFNTPKPLASVSS